MSDLNQQAPEANLDEQAATADPVKKYLGGTFSKHITNNRVAVEVSDLYEPMQAMGNANIHSLMSLIVFAHKEAFEAFEKSNMQKLAEWEIEQIANFNTLATPNAIPDLLDVTSIQVNFSMDDGDVVVDLQIRFHEARRAKLIYATRYAV